MNRIVLVGNGFDLAHGLHTKYEDFINWYWGKRIYEMRRANKIIVDDGLCSLKIKNENETWADYFFYSRNEKVTTTSNKDIIEFFINNKDIYEIKYTPLFENICESIETKGWVDIENEYYKLLSSFLNYSKYTNPQELNNALDIVRLNLIEYLTDIQAKKITEEVLNTNIKSKILEPFHNRDISVEKKHICDNFKTTNLEFEPTQCHSYFGSDADEIIKNIKKSGTEDRYLPYKLMLLNFNYTKTADMYIPKADSFEVNHIHGHLSDPKSVIFGYGDELDDDYKKLLKLNDNEYLHNIKSIKYLESDNYRKVLTFIESKPYQIYIMGHSCGNSDRTLLNTLFEHKNCVSIKPFYFKKEDGTDNYLDIVQNISRNFTDMKLMRDRVVNKKYCEPLSE